jgi:hypothetical protein
MASAEIDGSVIVSYVNPEEIIQVRVTLNEKKRPEYDVKRFNLGSGQRFYNCVAPDGERFSVDVDGKVRSFDDKNYVVTLPIRFLNAESLLAHYIDYNVLLVEEFVFSKSKRKHVIRHYLFKLKRNGEMTGEVLGERVDVMGNVAGMIQTERQEDGWKTTVHNLTGEETYRGLINLYAFRIDQKARNTIDENGRPARVVTDFSYR